MRPKFSWLRLAVFSLFLTALLGLAMRYKIAFDLPWLEQKNLREAHSHFAFYGWITSALYVFIIRYLQQFREDVRIKKYKWLVALNALGAFAMIPTFLYGGYYWASIVACSVCMFSSYFFLVFFITDAPKKETIIRPWYTAALVFSVISSLGIFGLSYFKVAQPAATDWQQMSIYFYLHFQYNGFFVMTCLGLLLQELILRGAVVQHKQHRVVFWLMTISVLVGYLLSLGGMKPSAAIVAGGLLSGIGQLAAVLLFFRLMRTGWSSVVKHWSVFQRRIVMGTGFVLLLKAVMQLVSGFPSVAELAFGNHNLTIAYLHWVLLLGVTPFLLARIFALPIFIPNRIGLLALRLFIVGIIVNEVLLIVKSFTGRPLTDALLVLVSVVIAGAAFLLWLGLRQKPLVVS